MSPRSSGSGGPYRKPRADLFTWMLLLSLVAIVIACICFFLEVQDYGDQPYQLSVFVPVARESPVMVAEGCGPQGPHKLDFLPCPATLTHG